MERDDIIRMAREAGFICLFPDEAVNGIGTIYDSGDEEITETVKRFAALVADHEREILRRDGWRKCAAGQRTTQFCAMAEEAVKAEREACARLCENIEDHDETIDDIYYSDHYAKAIRARGEK